MSRVRSRRPSGNRSRTVSPSPTRSTLAEARPAGFPGVMHASTGHAVASHTSTRASPATGVGTAAVLGLALLTVVVFVATGPDDSREAGGEHGAS